MKPEVKLLSQSFPCDLHLLNLRTNHDQKLPHFPVSSALMVIHRQGYSCAVGTDITLKHCPLSDKLSSGTGFYKLNNVNVTRTTLTGTRNKKYLDDGFQGINPMPMEIETYNVQFLQWWIFLGVSIVTCDVRELILILVTHVGLFLGMSR